MPKFLSLLLWIAIGVATSFVVMCMIFAVILFASLLLPALNVILGYKVLYAIMVGGIGCLGMTVTWIVLHLRKGKGTD